MEWHNWSGRTDRKGVLGIWVAAFSVLIHTNTQTDTDTHTEWEVNSWVMICQCIRTLLLVYYDEWATLALYASLYRSCHFSLLQHNAGRSDHSGGQVNCKSKSYGRRVYPLAHARTRTTAQTPKASCCCSQQLTWSLHRWWMVERRAGCRLCSKTLQSINWAT